MKNLGSLMKKFTGLDAVLFTSPTNVFYFTGYESDFAFLLMTTSKQFYFTDSRYIEEAKDIMGDGFTYVNVTRRDIFKKVQEALDEIGAIKVGFENSIMVYEDYIMLKTALTGKVLWGIDYVLNEIRSVKTRDELTKIRHAASINDRAFQRLMRKVREGVTEKMLAAELEYNMKKLGADDIAFKTIVAFGANTSKPHAHAGDTRLVRGMPVTIDFGCKYQGYCSDITRSFCFGTPPEGYERAYDAVLRANEEGIAACRAGENTKFVDRVCRDVLSEYDLEKYFLHGTGHGVGVEIHEAPTLNASSDEVLQKNSVVTVEPGVYFEGRYGIRVEDLLIVDKDGAKVISRTDKKLLIL